jgi:hypothetical protein
LSIIWLHLSSGCTSHFTVVNEWKVYIVRVIVPRCTVIGRAGAVPSHYRTLQARFFVSERLKKREFGRWQMTVRRLSDKLHRRR